MTAEARNEYGFPIIEQKLERAKEIAAAAKARIESVCKCQSCREKELLPVVQQILSNWSKQ